MTNVPKKISIKPPGSMVSKEALETSLRDATPVSSVESAQKKQSEEAEELKKQLRERQIDSLLPKFVFSAFSDTEEMAFDLFKDIYSTVWDQVKDKTHLARGYVDFSIVVHGAPITVRTFKSGESRALQLLVPPPDMGRTDYGAYLAAETQYRNARLILGLMEYDGTRLGDTGQELVKLGAKAWLKDEIVEGRLKVIDSMPEIMVEAISGILSDVTWAYRYATRENLKNQLAPLSPSTERG